MPKAIILSSGGLDSTTVLALAYDHFEGDIAALSILYGQKHKEEVQCSKAVAKLYGVPHHLVVLPTLFSQFGGAGSTVLEGGPDQPHLTYKQIAEGEGPSPTVVPYRNGTLLSVAATCAVQLGAEWIYAGMHAEDARGWAYPDCTPEFLGAMANAIRVGTYDKVRLATPLQWMMKKDVVALGLRLNAPFELTLSCYDGLRPACGKCPTCVERLAAFAANGVSDPIPYAGSPVPG